MNSPRGYQIVLTADRTLTSRYRLLFDGMLAASQTSTTPTWLLSPLLMPYGAGKYAPFGLRRIESALLAGGFRRESVHFVDEERVEEAIGSDTKIVGIATGEPLGLGMNSSTMTGVAGGRIYPEVLFRRLLKRVQRSIGNSGVKIVVGGPGAWQLAQNPEQIKALGISHVLTGYAEGNVGEVFQRIAAGDDLPLVIEGQNPDVSSIPPICGPSTMGVVEISRGCGLGCGYCTIGSTRMVHLSVETILSDVRTNVDAGQTSVALLSEDLFRYGADGMKVRPDALIHLLRSIRQIQGLRLIQVDHINICSAAQYSDEELEIVRDLLIGDTGARYPWVNVGIETASGRLLVENGGGPKMGAGRNEDWAEYCSKHIKRLCNAGFMPMLSLVAGLPGETAEDLKNTLAWVRSLNHEAVTVFPVVHAPINGGDSPLDKLTPLHWQLVREAYKMNFKWIPKMYWDNQTAAGESMAKKLLIQILGKGQVIEWTALLAYRQWRSR